MNAGTVTACAAVAIFALLVLIAAVPEWGLG